MNRAVDAAMAADRPDKRRVRELWCDLVERNAGEDVASPEPLYVTLSGAEGRDIDLLIERGLLHRTEVGAIAPEDSAKVVAIEPSLPAVAQLQGRFPGLRVVREPISNLVAGMDLTAWPSSRDHRLICRGLILNFDLNSALGVQRHHGQLVFPVIRWIEKVAHLHAGQPQRDWWLCLTLNATIGWTDEVVRAVQEFLAENFDLVAEFGTAARDHLGGQLYETIATAHDAPLPELEPDARQRVLMTLVPKKLASSVAPNGWRLTTICNLRYGGDADAAPMVSWIFRFHWDDRAFATPQQVYRESLLGIHEALAAIAADGTVS